MNGVQMVDITLLLLKCRRLISWLRAGREWAAHTFGDERAAGWLEKQSHQAKLSEMIWPKTTGTSKLYVS